MRRGTTTTLTFGIGFDSETIEVLNIAFEQNKKLVLEKTLGDCLLNGNKILLPLSELDTLSLTGSTRVNIQIRARLNNGDRIASNIMEGFVERIIKDGELT